MGVVRRGEGHWKDEMKLLPPALTDLVNNVKSFFSPATLFSGPKHSEKKIVPTAEGKEEEMKGTYQRYMEWELNRPSTALYSTDKNDSMPLRGHLKQRKGVQCFERHRYSPLQHWRVFFSNRYHAQDKR